MTYASLSTRRVVCASTMVAAVLLAVALSKTAIAAPVPPPLPGTAWLLDEGSGTDLAEWTGYRTGEIGGHVGIDPPIWSTDTPFTYTGNHSLSFLPSGTGLPGNWARLDGHPSGEQGTISLWITGDAGTSTRYMLDATDGHRTLIYRSTGDYTVYLNQTHIGSVSQTLVPTDGSWAHVVMTWDNSLATDKQKFYKDGALFATLNTSISARNPASVYLGSRVSLTEAWSGKIDEYALWDTALGEDQIQWLSQNSLQQIRVPMAPKPVAAWKFDEGGGTTARDFIGTNDGTLYGGVTWSDNTPHAADYGNNHAVWFDGQQDTRINFGPHTYGTEGSIQVWVYHDDASGTQYVMDSSSGARTLLYGGWSLWLNNTPIGGLSSGLIPLDEWTHLVITWDDSDVGQREKVYKNGGLFATFDIPLGTSSPSMLWLGNRHSNNEGWKGGMDEYALWDTALTPDQIHWLYHNSLGLMVPEPGTLALALLGLPVLVGLGRRRRRRK